MLRSLEVDFLNDPVNSHLFDDPEETNEPTPLPKKRKQNKPAKNKRKEEKSKPRNAKRRKNRSWYVEYVCYLATVEAFLFFIRTVRFVRDFFNAF